MRTHYRATPLLRKAQARQGHGAWTDTNVGSIITIMRIRSRFAGGAHYYIFASLSLLDLRERPNHESLERRTLSLNQEDLSGRRDSLPQDRPDIKQAREEWTLTRQPIM